jgi:excisionase family DNA binding protein
MEETKSLVTADRIKSLFDTREAAEYIGIEPGTLEVWRCVKRHNIPYIKSGRLVRYRREALDAWLESRTVGAEAA